MAKPERGVQPTAGKGLAGPSDDGAARGPRSVFDVLKRRTIRELTRRVDAWRDACTHSRDRANLAVVPAFLDHLRSLPPIPQKLHFFWHDPPGLLRSHTKIVENGVRGRNT